MPRTRVAISRAAAGSAASWIPPALPRPPTCTWALTTTGTPSSSATCSASSGDQATWPRGTRTPCSANSAFAWYSNRSMLAFRQTPRGPPHPPAASGWSGGDVQRLPEPVDDALRRRPRGEDLRHAVLLEDLDV